MDTRIAAARVQMEDRDKTKDVALGTSKINYIVGLLLVIRLQADLNVRIHV